MKQNQNSRRNNQIAREKLASILLFEISDPDLALVTLTGVEVSVDKSFLRAYVSCEASRYEEVSAALGRQGTHPEPSRPRPWLARDPRDRLRDRHHHRRG